MEWNLHAIEQMQLRRQHRVDCVGRLKFDFHTGRRLPALRRRGLVARFASQPDRRLPIVGAQRDGGGAAAPEVFDAFAANCLDRAALFERVWRVLERVKDERQGARRAVACEAPGACLRPTCGDGPTVGAAAPRRSILEKRVRDAPRGRSWNGRGVGEYVRDFVSREGDASLAFFGGFG